MSLASISANLSTSATTNTSTSLNFRAFSNLDLSEDQRKQIRSIVKNVLENGTSPDDVSSAINNVLTPTQQAQLANNESSISSRSSSTTGSANVASLQSPPPHGSKDENEPFASLNLTSNQKSAIEKILASAQSSASDGTNSATAVSTSTTSTSDSIQDQINQVLTTAQQATLSAEYNSGLNQSSAVGSLISNVADQIAAANTLITKQLQSQLQ